MHRLIKLLIPLGLVALVMCGCVIAPAGYYRGYYRGYYHRGYYGPRVAVVAPVLVVRP